MNDRTVPLWAPSPYAQPIRAWILDGAEIYEWTDGTLTARLEEKKK